MSKEPTKKLPGRSRLEKQLQVVIDVLLKHPSVAIVLAVSVWVFTIVHAIELTYLNDEGFFTFEFSILMREHFWPVFFTLRSKPGVTALYIPTTPLGLTTYLVLHGALAAATVWLVCRTARLLRIEYPNFAGWMMALSAGYLGASAAGMANTDGAFFLALFLWAYLGKRRYLAAVILGFMPFVRLEFAVVWFAFVLWDIRKRRDYRFPLVAAALPGLYYLGAAIFLGSILWPITHFPAPAGKPPDISGYTVPRLAQIGVYLGKSLTVNVGIFGLLAILGWPRAKGEIRHLFILAFSFLAIMTVSLYFDLFGYDASLRYHVVLLPLFAVMAAHALSSGAKLPWVGVLLLCLLLLLKRFEIVIVLAAAVALLQLSERDTPLRGLVKPAYMAIAAVSLLLALWSPLGREQHIRSHKAMNALRKTGLYSGQHVYTDLNVTRYDHCSGVKNVSMLANEAILWELQRYFPEHLIPRKELIRTYEGMRFIIAPEQHRVRRDALYYLRGGPRTRRWRRLVESKGPERLRVGRFWLYHWPGKSPGGRD